LEPGTLVADRIAQLLQREGAEFVVGFPENRLLDSASALGIRPVVTRTERVAVNIADGFTRAANGERIAPCVTQYGPGVEAAFAAVAQAHGDRSPVLLIPGEHDRGSQDPPNIRAETAYAPVTRFAATVNDAARAPEVFRRALHRLRCVRDGPVLVAVANDVMCAPAGEASWDASPGPRRLSSADPEDVAETLRMLARASRPVILAGQGVLYAGATDELVAFAEHTGIPVATTLNGKSAFPEDHPLALGTAARTRPETIDRFLGEADVVLGVGTSFTRSLYIAPLPESATLGQIVADPRDLGTGYDIAFGCVGDARVVLRQMLDRLDAEAAPARDPAPEIARLRSGFLDRWMPRLTSDAGPISPYRVVWDLMAAVDRSRAIVTHDAGHPRDQIVPFYEALVPRGYLGWGKSTQLGTGLGLTMGARLARPDRLAVNIMGDAAFGMVGMDVETAVRCDIPILTIVMNNGLMGGYGEYMPRAVERYGAHRLSGDYAAVGAALGAYSERVAEAGELRAAISRCARAVESGRTALLEVMTHEEPELALGSGM
jgi:thiamine pyrophosphate-dependent acetolactate synthase large subunit-like protein